MLISPISIQNIQNISPSFGKRTIKSVKPVDTFKIQDSEKIYEKNIQTILNKLTSDEIDKAYLDNFLAQYNEEDKKIVKEIFAAAAPILTFGGILTGATDLFQKNSLGDEFFIKIDSNVCDFMSYLHKRHCYSSIAQPSITKLSIDKLPKNASIHNIFNSYVHYITDGIFNRDLTDNEIDSLNNIKNLEIIDLCSFETLPNFIDFAISDDKAKKKIDSLLEKIKSLKKDYPNLSTKEALDCIRNFYLEKNIEKINKTRGKQSIQELLAIGFDEEIATAKSSFEAVSCKKLASKCENYDEIDNFLGLKPQCATRKGTMLELRDYLTGIKNKGPEKLSQETLKDNFEKIYEEPQKAAQAIASDEFTYYTPKKFIDSLKLLFEKLKKDLSSKKCSLNDCVFLYKKGKSDAFIGYLLEEMGLISPKQRIETSTEEIPEDKILVYVDDILGSGETAKIRLLENLNKRNYCLHIVSSSIGRFDLKDKVNMIYAQDSFNSVNSKYKYIKEDAYGAASFIDGCNSSEIFFFSYPDTCHETYARFGKYLLGLKEREGAV